MLSKMSIKCTAGVMAVRGAGAFMNRLFYGIKEVQKRFYFNQL
jgi:hypothetical protein